MPDIDVDAVVRDELRTVARGLLGKARPLDWRLLASSGWAGLEVPLALDGEGASFAETCVICEELGRAAARTPYLGAVVLGVGTLLALSPCQERDEVLRQAARGETVPVAVLANAGFRLERTAAGWRLSGQADFAPDAAEADWLLVVASVSALSSVSPLPSASTLSSASTPTRRIDNSKKAVVAVVRSDAPGLRVEAMPVLDETRRLARVSADGVAVPEESVWRFAGDSRTAVGRLLDRAAVAVACDSLGIAEAMLDTTVSYVKMREQFGRPVGSFQAVQHACADMFVQVRAGRELVAAAVEAVASGDPDAWAAASMAKSHVCAAAVDVAGKAMQLHGGIGYTWESGIHVYLKRSALNRVLFGSPADHRKRLAARYGV